MYCSSCKREREFETHFRVIEGDQGKLWLFPEQRCVECGGYETGDAVEMAGEELMEIMKRIARRELKMVFFGKGELLFKENV